MTLDRLKSYMLPPGPILSLTLIGVMVLSALLYYRAVKIQRFLEPALALSQPRNLLSERFNVLLRKEFGSHAGLQGMSFGMGAIIAEASVFFGAGDTINTSAGELARKLSAVFYAALQDEHARAHTAVVLVGAGYHMSNDVGASRNARQLAQRRAEAIMDQLLAADPRLAREFGTYFIAAAIPAGSPSAEAERIEFRIIPSEMLHVEVLQRLNKYIQ